MDLDKKIFIVFSILLIALPVLSGCAAIEKDTDASHSDDWDKIEELLYTQCKARVREDWDALGSLYSFAEDSFEYMDLKRISKLAFRTVSILSCEYTLKEIEFQKSNTIAYAKADLYLKEVERRDLGNKKEGTVSLPPEGDPNFLKFVKIGKEWKFCPAEDCSGRHSDLISCTDGTMVSDKKDCPVLDVEFYSEKTLAECVENHTAIDLVLMKNIGPFYLNPVSIVTAENDTKIYKASDTKVGKLDIVSAYSADYQRLSDKKHIINVAYIELGDDLDFRRYVNETHIILAELLDKYNGSRVEDIDFGGTVANIAYFPTARVEEKAVTITKRAYVYIPEKRVIIRFLFNDWLVDEDVPYILSTYFNNFCEA